jgi:hypothetical protein
MESQQKKSGRGCLFWGGIIAAVFFLFILLTVYAGFRYVKNMIAEYTDTKPLPAPTLHLSAVEITNLQQRVHLFDQAIKSNKPVEPLSLSADEINELIAHEAISNASPARLFFSFNSNQVQAQLSVPTDGLGLRMLRGRYFNGSGNFAVALHDGRLNVNIKSLSVKGRPLPEKFLQPLREQNFADGWTNDVSFNEAIAKLEEIKIENGKLIVIPKPHEAQSEAKTNAAPNLEKPEPAK